MVLKRRTFIRKAAVVSVAVSVSPSFAINAGIGQKNLSVALAGCSEKGIQNLKLFLEHPKVECVAIYDQDYQVLQKAAEVIAKMQNKKPLLFQNYQRMIDDGNIHVLIDNSPERTISSASLYACEAGKHVYTGLPDQFEQYQLLLQAQKKYNSVVQLDLWQKSDEDRQYLLNQISKGEFGQVCSARIWMYGDQTYPWQKNGVFAGLADMVFSSFNYPSPDSVVTYGGNFFSSCSGGDIPGTYVTVIRIGPRMIMFDYSDKYESINHECSAGAEIVCTSKTIVAGNEGWKIIDNLTNNVIQEERQLSQANELVVRKKHIQNFIHSIYSGQEPVSNLKAFKEIAMVPYLESKSIDLGRIVVAKEA